MGKIMTAHFLTIFLFTVIVNTLSFKIKISTILTTYNDSLAGLKSTKKH